MRNRIVIGLGIAAALSLTACSESPEEALANRWPMLEQYCTECHNDAEAAGDMSLEGITPAEVAANPEKWETVVRRLRGSVMPPPGGEHPAVEQVNEFVAAVEANLDSAAAARGAAPGRVHVAPVESRRIRHGGARSAGRRRRRHSPAAAGRDERRLRQRRRGPAGHSDVSRSVHRRRARRQYSCRWQPAREACSGRVRFQRAQSLDSRRRFAAWHA